MKEREELERSIIDADLNADTKHQKPAVQEILQEAREQKTNPETSWKKDWGRRQ